MRIIFIPGFGEDEKIFSKILPFIPGDKLVLDSWKITADYPVPDMNVLQVAKALIVQHNITIEDIVIGHSMGGWIAYHIKHYAGCKIVQVASWTHPAKVLLPVTNRAAIYWAARKGLYLNRFIKWLLIQLHYRNQPSREIFDYVFEKLLRGNKNNILNQLRIILTPVNEKIHVQPDLRIHAIRDNIIRYPDEPFQEVPGDHFTVYTHPEVIYPLLLHFLEKQNSI